MKAIIDRKILIEGSLLKPNMVTPGADCPDRKSPQEVTWITVRTLSRTIMPALPAITFLSGGQSEEDASLHLNVMNSLQGIAKPWALTFSYGHALQKTVLKVWSGKPENVVAAQAALLERATANGLASLGQYKGGAGDKTTQFVANYSY